MDKRPIGQILPGTIKVEEVIQLNTDEPTTWRVTLVAQPGAGGSLPLLEATVQFVTSDRGLVEQIRERKLRYALDLLELEEQSEDKGLLDIAQRDDT
jgi:hypothetical protein